MLPATRRFDPERMFRPRSIALLGASSATGQVVLRNIRQGGFAGPLAIADDPAAFASPPDLALLCDAAHLPALPALAATGCRAAALLDRATNLGPLARAAGLRALGPGSFGIASPGLNATMSHLPIPPGHIALVSQSASLCRAVIDWAAPNGVGFSAVIGLGANKDAGFATALDWLARDPSTGLILLDIRDLRDRRAFFSAARAAARLRPVVALRPGTRLADPSGNADAAFDALLRRAGIVRVSRFADFLAAAETFARARPARGDALAIATNALGPGQLAADAATALHLPVVKLSPEAQAALGLLLGRPSWRLLSGGIAYAGVTRPTRVADAAAMLGALPETGGIVAILAPTGEEDAAAIEALAAAAATLRAPLVAAILGETTAAAHRRRLAEAGLPAFASPELAVRAFHNLVELRHARAAARELPPRAVLHFTPNTEAVRTILAATRQAGRLALSQDEARAVLAAYGLTSGDVPASPTLRITAHDDPFAGPIIGFGTPTTLAWDLPPLNLPLAEALIARSPAPARIADALVRVSQLLVDFPEIATLGFDPSLVAGAAIGLHPPASRPASPSPPIPPNSPPPGPPAAKPS